MAKRRRRLITAASELEPAAPWRIRFSPRLLSEDYDVVGHAAFEMAHAAIDKKLKVNPHGYGAPLHAPLHGLYKLKAGHVRIVYHIEDARHEVWILMIGSRRDIWDESQSEITHRLDVERDMRATPDVKAQGPVRKKKPRR